MCYESFDDYLGLNKRYDSHDEYVDDLPTCKIDGSTIYNIENAFNADDFHFLDSSIIDFDDYYVSKSGLELLKEGFNQRIESMAKDFEISQEIVDNHIKDELLNPTYEAPVYVIDNRDNEPCLAFPSQETITVLGILLATNRENIKLEYTKVWNKEFSNVKEFENKNIDIIDRFNPFWISFEEATIDGLTYNKLVTEIYDDEFYYIAYYDNETKKVTRYKKLNEFTFLKALSKKQS